MNSATPVRRDRDRDRAAQGASLKSNQLSLGSFLVSPKSRAATAADSAAQGGGGALGKENAAGDGARRKRSKPKEFWRVGAGSGEGHRNDDGDDRDSDGAAQASGSTARESDDTAAASKGAHGRGAKAKKPDPPAAPGASSAVTAPRGGKPAAKHGTAAAVAATGAAKNSKTAAAAAAADARTSLDSRDPDSDEDDLNDGRDSDDDIINANVPRKRRKRLHKLSATENSDAAEGTMTAATPDKSAEAAAREIAQLKNALEASQRQYDELRTVGIVEADARFTAMQQAADARYEAYDEMIKHLEAENARLRERVQALSLDNDELRASSGARLRREMHEQETQAPEEAVVERPMVDKEAHDEEVRVWAERHAESEVHAARLQAQVEAMQVQLERAAQHASEQAQQLDAAVQAHAALAGVQDRAARADDLDRAVRVYEEFTGLRILGVERVVRAVEDAEGETPREQAFVAFQCHQQGPRNEIQFTLLIPADDGYGSCSYVPALQADLADNQQLPEFLREEIEFARELLQMFFARMTAFLHPEDAA
nr:hypothetical protein HK105_006276 [Polyrhizophydium stewartii]